MVVALETARRETSGWKVYLLAGYYLAVGNMSLSIAVVGVLQVLLGLLLDTVYVTGDYEGNFAILAGFFGIWGITLVVVGLGTYFVFWANKVYGQQIREGGIS